MSEPGTLISKGKLEVADVSALQLPQRNRRAWLHAGFCVVSLPHSKPKDARDDHVVDGDGYKLILRQSRSMSILTAIRFTPGYHTEPRHALS